MNKLEKSGVNANTCSYSMTYMHVHIHSTQVCIVCIDDIHTLDTIVILHSVEEVEVERGVMLHILSLLRAEVPDVVATAAAAGDSNTIFSYLSKHPEEVSIIF